MPLEGYVCPPGTPTAGDTNPVAYCLKGGTPGGCPHPCVSPPLLAAMFRAERANHHQGAYISASMLTGDDCARQTQYERTEPFHEVPVNRFWPYRGTIAHAVIEGAGDLVADYGWMQELRMSVQITYPEHPAPIFDEHGVWTGEFDHTRPLIITLGGTTDAYNPLTVPPQIDDFKSMADVKAVAMAKGTSGGSFSKNLQDGHVWQTNIYRYLVAHTRIPDDIRERYGLVGEFYPAPERLVLQGFSMMTLPKSGSSVEVSVKKGKTTERVTYQIDEVPVLPLDQIEAYIRPRLYNWYRYLVLGERAPLPPFEMKWLCINCRFNGEKVDGGKCFPSAEREAIAEAMEEAYVPRTRASAVTPLIHVDDPYA